MYERGYRALGRNVLILVAIPVVYLVIRTSVAYVAGPTLYEGDRIEARKCRECGGAGKDAAPNPDFSPAGGRCPFCAGKGTVDVIVPGPNRPVRVWGSVVDLAASDGLYAYSNPHNIRMVPMQAALAPPEISEIRGALPGASVRLEREGRRAVELKTLHGGRFSVPLAPGQWKLTASAPGFQTHEQTIEVLPLTEPIWLEKATLIRELPTEEARSECGLSLLVSLSRPGRQGSFARLGPAGW